MEVHRTYLFFLVEEGRRRRDEIVEVLRRNFSDDFLRVFSRYCRESYTLFVYSRLLI